MDNLCVKLLCVPDIMQFSDFDCGVAYSRAIPAYYETDQNKIKLLNKLKTRKTT